MTATVWPDRLDLVVFDFDGVLTDNTVIVDQDGHESVVCHRGDSLGIERMRLAGVAMLVLSKEKNGVVGARCRKLLLPFRQGIDDKIGELRNYIREHGYSAAYVAYVGNDINDAECLREVGLPVVVGDAHPSVLPMARLVLSATGGRGAVREFCDLFLERYHTA